MSAISITISRKPCLPITAWLIAVAGATGIRMVNAAEPTVVEEARAADDPWSGYWWPHFQGLIAGPLAKYDALHATQSVAWERSQHPTTSANWHGYCHGWAASAVLEPEPNQQRSMRRPDGTSVAFAVGDQKGLLAVSHAGDSANVYGDRFGDGIGGENRDDIAPDVLWQLLRQHVKEQRVPLVVDAESGNQVWNFPVYAYRVRHVAGAEPDERAATLSLWMADDFVPPNYVGLRVKKHDYTFTFRMRDGAIVAGSGRWTHASRLDHPDFAWYPYLVVPGNPHVDYARVLEIVGRPGGSLQPASGSAAAPIEPATATGSPAPADAAAPPAAAPVVIGLMPDGSVAASPQDVAALVANRTSSFALDVTVDRFDGGTYREGDVMTVSVSSEEPGYLTLLLVDAAGELGVLYPQPGDDGRIEAKTRTTLPGPKAGYRYRTTAPHGVDRIRAIVTQRPLALCLRANAGREHSPVQETAGGRQAPRPVQEPVQVRDAGAIPLDLSPTQQEQLRQIIGAVTSEQRQADAVSALPDPAALLGRFACDEVLFRVVPTGPPSAKPPRNQTPPSPAGSK